jgi:ParB family transcriptional regulator, chromosome partitioning protein
MNEPKFLQITSLPLGDIAVRDRLRPVSAAAVQSLIASIQELGVMKDPIHVRKRKGGEFVLIAGGHRLEAARELGWAEIPVKVWADVTDDWARIMEIDDNLAGAEMCALDNAVFLARRKEVYERLHPESVAKTGAALVATRWNTADMMSVVSFASSTAEKFGLTDRHVRRMIAAGTALRATEVQQLRTAPRPVTLKDLDAIGRIGEPDERSAVVSALAEGKAKSAAEARRAYMTQNGDAQPLIKDPAEEGFRAIASLWVRLPMAAKRRFADDYARELLGLIPREAKGA